MLSREDYEGEIRVGRLTLRDVHAVEEDSPYHSSPGCITEQVSIWDRARPRIHFPRVRPL